MKNEWIIGPLLAAALLSGLCAGPAAADERTDKVDKIFAAWDRPDSPGVSLAVIENGAVVYARGYGRANLELGVPLSPSSVFYIASTSKQFTAMCAVLLSLQGKLSLDDDVRKYIPELPDYGTPITVRMLANHTAGLRDELVLTQMAGRDFGTVHRAEAVALVARQKELNFEPGTQYAYSNSGYLLLSLVVERAAGKSFREYAQEAIFGPLGMTHSRFHDDFRVPIVNRASGYLAGAARGEYLNYITTYDGVGAGGLYTSVEDMALWDRNFYEAKVGGPEALRLMQTPAVLKSGEKLDYALGLMLGSYKGLPVVHHGGILEGYRAEIMRFPEQRFSVVVLANLSTIDPTKLTYQVAEVWLADRFKEEPKATSGPKPSFITLSEKRLKELAGTYLRLEDRSLLSLPLQNGKLMVDYQHLLIPLVAVSETELQVPTMAVFRFVPTAPGKPPAFDLLFGNQKPSRYEKLEPFVLGAAETAALSGSYWCDELETEFSLAVRDGKLILRRGTAPPEVLIPTARDQFTAETVALRIVRDASGAVGGFRLDGPRARNFWCGRSAGKSGALGR
jgi:CubicO group peptidase (beta-lactamase class C family)